MIPKDYADIVEELIKQEDRIIELEKQIRELNPGLLPIEQPNPEENLEEKILSYIRSVKISKISSEHYRQRFELAQDMLFDNRNCIISDSAIKFLRQEIFGEEVK